MGIVASFRTTRIEIDLQGANGLPLHGFDNLAGDTHEGTRPMRFDANDGDERSLFRHPERLHARMVFDSGGREGDGLGKIRDACGYRIDVRKILRALPCPENQFWKTGKRVYGPRAGNAKNPDDKN
jgi:hypothetical protein